MTPVYVVVDHQHARVAHLLRIDVGGPYVAVVCGAWPQTDVEPGTGLKRLCRRCSAAAVPTSHPQPQPDRRAAK